MRTPQFSDLDRRLALAYRQWYATIHWHDQNIVTDRSNGIIVEAK